MTIVDTDVHTYDKDGRQDQLTLDKRIKSNTIMEVFTQLMRLVLFQSILSFWQSKRRIIIQV